MLADSAIVKIATMSELWCFFKQSSADTGILVDHIVPLKWIEGVFKENRYSGKTLFVDAIEGIETPCDETPGSEESQYYSGLWTRIMRRWSVGELNEPRQPSRGDICAVVHPAIAKSAALLYDKIYFPTRRDTLPHDEDWADLPPPDLTFGIDGDSFCGFFLDKDEKIARSLDAIAKSYHSQGVKVVRGYHVRDSLMGRIAVSHRDGQDAILAALARIPLVADSHTTWEQVKEFRADKESLLRYREMRLWLRESFKASTVEEAQERISLLFDRYEDAINKHGLQTRLGRLAQVWDSRATFAATASGITTSIALGKLWPALVAGAVVVGRVCLEVKRMNIESSLFRDSAPGREVAYLYDVKRKFPEEVTDAS
jgi:hypothetical protein